MKKIFASFVVMGLIISAAHGQTADLNSSSNQEKKSMIPSKNEFLVNFGTFNLDDATGVYYDRSGAYSFSFGFKHHFSNVFSMSLNNEYGSFNYSMLNNLPSADVSLSNLNLLSHFKVFSLDDISIEVAAGMSYSRLTDNTYKIYFREGFNTNTQTKTYDPFTTLVHSIDENIALPVQLQINKSFKKCNLNLGYKYNFVPEEFYNYNLGSRFYMGLSIPL